MVTAGALMSTVSPPDTVRSWPAVVLTVLLMSFMTEDKRSAEEKESVLTLFLREASIFRLNGAGAAMDVTGQIHA
jgi:hypothetical protein